MYVNTEYLEGVHISVVNSTLGESHRTPGINNFTHLQAIYRTLDSFVSAWSTLKRFDEGGGQLRKPQLENGRKLGFRAESPLPLALTIQHQTGQICYRISYLTNKLTPQRMR